MSETVKVRENFMPTVGGKPFRCSCGCNVFHKANYDRHIYICNACEVAYTDRPEEHEGGMIA